MSLGSRAALEVGRQFGVDAKEAVLLQETNNVVVWLRPEPVVAKVATRADAQADLQLEHAVAVELVAAGAEIAPPLAGAVPTRHEPSGYVVTLWDQLEGASQLDTMPSELAASLRRLHAALRQVRVELPSFRVGVDRARAALDDDSFVSALSSPDRAFLGDVYEETTARLDARRVDQQHLHGEPHQGNRLLTADGIRWIDFESCCVGPLEWDLTFQPHGVEALFADADTELLGLLRRLNSARVATWCLGQARFPMMRRHGEIHLNLLRDSPIGP